ncbi:Reverse transcriptase domain [Trinorchestia longiramus]|nr:Reverse transcriptase domain [Trinorchestia longiramus]
MRTNSLQQHVNESTRGNNILELVMTTNDLSTNGLEVTDKIGDHQMIEFSLDVQDPNTRTQHKQHGFREKCSCLINLLDFFGEVNRIYNRTEAADLVYLDFQKAFDKVPHERIMAKVEVHGIRRNYSRWIRNWLTGRTQRVVIHDETSDSTLVTSRVPQGSVLGPLLFTIYINDVDVRIIN